MGVARDGMIGRVDAVETVDGALGDGRLLVVGDYLMCQACGWAVRASAVGLVAEHVRGCGEPPPR